MLRYCKFFFLGFFILATSIAGYSQFITTWQTTDTEITIPTTGVGYDYNVTWTNLTNGGVGDGSTLSEIGNFTIMGLTDGDIYQVEITGMFPRIYFNNSGDKDKILTIEQWGSNQWTSMANAFYGCSNLTITDLNAPDLFLAFDLSQMFRNASSINADLSSWDVSNVELFNGMFRGASLFNGNISNWDINGAEEMSSMFSFASSFNQDISGWRPDNVTTMASMFAGATVFNQPINTIVANGTWITSSVTNMNQMFSVAVAFDQDISNWNTANVSNMTSMFSGASAFNRDISSWDISDVTSLVNLFRNARAFNQDLSAWNALIGNITNMSGMFEGATDFNQNINGWDVSNVTNMDDLFRGTTFNSDISGWNVSSVRSFHSMFNNNTAFNQDISGWLLNTISSIDMRLMFDGATAFDQNIGGWDMSRVNNLVRMLDNSGLSIENYDNLLIGWSIQPLSSNENLGASGLFYCARATARQEIIDNLGWTINDAGQGCIVVFEGDDTTGPEIFNGQANPIDFGSINMGASKTYSFTIENRLAVDLTNFNVVPILGSLVFSVTTPVLPVTITAGNTQIIEVQLDGLTIGDPFNETLSITSDNFPDPFEFNLIGAVTATAQPEIAVFEGSLTTGNIIIDDVSSYDIGTELRGTDATNQITIENKGSAVLNISSFAISGSAFSLNPSSPVAILVDGTLIITITLDGSIGAFYSETLTITNDDSDENPFDFEITGIIQGPDIAVFKGTTIFNPQIFDGQSTPVEFGTSPEGVDIVYQLTIGNYGPVDLSISNISISGSAFSVTSTVPSLIAAEFDGIVSSAPLEITLSGAVGGSFSETVTIVNDDDDESNFTFIVEGAISDPNAPKVYWSEQNGNEINRSDLDGTAPEQYHAEALYEPRGIAIDSLNNIIYWTNEWGQIRKGEIDATGLINVTDFMNDGINLPREMGGLSLDVAGDIIYWASIYDGEIKSAQLSSPDPANVTITSIVTGLENPTSVTVDVAGSQLYYTTNFNNAGADDNIASLHVVDIAGSNDMVLTSDQINGEEFTYRDVKLDLASNKIYWSAGGDNEFNEIGVIYTADLSDISGTKLSFATFNENPLGIDLDLKNGKIYWVESSTYMEPDLIQRANLDGTMQENIVPQSNSILSRPQFIALDVSSLITGCASPPTANAGTDQTICEGGDATLVASFAGAATSIGWTTSGDGSFDDATSLTAVYSPGAADITTGSATLTLTTDDPDGAGACIAATDDLLLTINQAAVVGAGADQTICEGDVATLAASLGGSAATVLWTTAGDGTFDDNTSLTAIYTPGSADIIAGTVTLTTTTDDPDTTGPCLAATDDMIIAIDLAHTVDAGVDQSVCLNDQVNITGVLSGSATSAVWSSSGDGAFVDVNVLTTVYTPGVADNSFGSVSLSLTTLAGLACSDIADDLIISISQPITVVDQAASLDVAATITVDVTNGATLNAGDVLTTTLVTNPAKGTAIINASGNIDYTAAAGTVGADSFEFQLCNQCNQCSSATIEISINNVPPTADIPSSSVVAGEAVAINVLDGIFDDNGNLDLSSLIIISQPNPSGAPASLDVNGLLTVDYTNINFAGTDQVGLEICDVDGLCSQFIVTIEVAPPGVVVYNAVSPNGDGKHDFLEIQNAELFPGNQVKILNRWGNIVFDMTAYDNASNRFEGKANNGSSGDLPPGTYFYTISLGDGSADITGFFTLRR